MFLEGHKKTSLELNLSEFTMYLVSSISRRFIVHQAQIEFEFTTISFGNFRESSKKKVGSFTS
jgi:hypothetical protein